MLPEDMDAYKYESIQHISFDLFYYEKQKLRCGIKNVRPQQQYPL